jgi:hypothetical protein
MGSMTTITTTVRLETDLIRACQRYQAETGCPVSVQIRRALTMFLADKGIAIESAAKKVKAATKAKPVTKKRRSR